MKLCDFMFSEFINLFKIECGQYLSKEENNVLHEKLNKITFENLEDFKLLDDYLYKSERLSFIADQVSKIGQMEYLLTDLNLLKKKMNNEPNNRLYPIFWAKTQVELFEKEEYFESEIVAFLEILLNKYGHLIELDDFLSTLGLFSQFFHFDRLEQDKEILLPFLQRAVKEYPDKDIFRLSLAQIFYYNGDFRESLFLANVINERVKEKYENLSDIDLDDFCWIQYNALILLLARNYNKLGDYSQILPYVDFYISAISPMIYSKDSTEYDEPGLYLEPYLLKMKANMLLGNKDDVERDYLVIKETLSMPDKINLNNDLICLWMKRINVLKVEFSDVLQFVVVNFD